MSLCKQARAPVFWEADLLAGSGWGCHWMAVGKQSHFRERLGEEKPPTAERGGERAPSDRRGDVIWAQLLAREKRNGEYALAEQRANNLRHLGRRGKYAFLRVFDYGPSTFCSALLLFSPNNTALCDLRPLVLWFLSFMFHFCNHDGFFAIILKSKHGFFFFFCFKLYRFSGGETTVMLCA